MENGSSATVEDAQPESKITANDADPAVAESEDAQTTGAEAEGAAEAVEESPAALREALAAAQAEAEAQKDRALRAAAEVENIRKRTDRRVENAHKFALEGFVADLLPAVDSFERAVQAAQDAAETARSGEGEAASGLAAVAEGVQLSLKLLLEAMQRQGIEVVDPLGAPFDPNLHEAMTMVASETAEPGAVVDVFQKGYTVNGRLARAARVVVAKAPEPSAEGTATGDGGTPPDAT